MTPRLSRSPAGTLIPSLPRGSASPTEPSLPSCPTRPSSPPTLPPKHPLATPTRGCKRKPPRGSNPGHTWLPLLPCARQGRELGAQVERKTGAACPNAGREFPTEPSVAAAGGGENNHGEEIMDGAFLQLPACPNSATKSWSLTSRCRKSQVVAIFPPGLTSPPCTPPPSSCRKTSRLSLGQPPFLLGLQSSCS